MKNPTPLFTVFTGTYNSETIMDRVFKSIKSQSFRNFEWIIIDDCSKDGTVNLIQEFIAQIDDITIRFIKHKENQGVAKSRKEALYLAKGKYFVTWDHDDIQSANQLEIYNQLWQTHDASDIANIFAKLTDQHGNRLGKPYPKDPYLSDYINTHNTYLVGNKSQGNVVEHHVCVKINEFKMVLDYFQDHPKLLREYQPNGGDIWGMLAYLGYKTLYTNQVVRTYYINESGRTTMSDTSRKKGAERVYLYKLLWVNYWQLKLKQKSIKWTLRNILAVGMYGFLNGLSIGRILQDVKPIHYKILTLLSAFPAFLLSKRFQ
jgi:glycosyltransferase involved in cell wall biosynthesis